MAGRVYVYTDGGSRGNPGIGAWGVFIENEKKEIEELSGFEENTTNNKMELTAAIEGLSHLDKEIDIVLYTDSKYVKDGITKWIKNWKVNGWKTAAKKPVKNADLWKKLDSEVNNHNVTWSWVKGHSGNKGNEIADNLCNKEMDKFERIQKNCTKP